MIEGEGKEIRKRVRESAATITSGLARRGRTFVHEEKCNHAFQEALQPTQNSAASNVSGGGR